MAVSTQVMDFFMDALTFLELKTKPQINTNKRVIVGYCTSQIWLSEKFQPTD